MSETKPRYTLVVEFDGDPPRLGFGDTIIGGELVAVQFDDALAENERLLRALRDAIGRPMGVVPDSANEFLSLIQTVPEAV